MPAPLRTLFLLLLFICWLPCLGQQPERYAFTHYGLADGLASNIVNNVVQDRDGFIWLSTNNGLQRFDGNKFTTFRHHPADPHSLPYDEVAQVYLDRKHNLWVLTVDNKVGIFNTRTFRYREVPVRQWRSDNVYVEKYLLETTDGQLLLVVRRSRQLYCLNGQQEVFQPYDGISAPNGWKVNHLAQDAATGRYLMATDSGLVVYDPQTKTYAYKGASGAGDPWVKAWGGERFLNYVFIDSRSRVFVEQWVKTERFPVLQVLDPGKEQRTTYNFNKTYGLGYHQIRAVLEQKGGNTWVYGLPFLAAYNGAGQPLQFLKKDYNKEHELRFGQVYAMYEDRQRNTWVCTDDGVYLFNPEAQLFHNYTLTIPERYSVEGRAQTALHMPDGTLWVGFRDLGLQLYNRQLQPMPLPPSLSLLQQRRSVWDIHLHRATGNLWIALQGGQVVVYDTLRRKARLLTPPQLERRAITQIAEDAAGNLWLGNQAGNIVKWDRKAGAHDPRAGFLSVAKAGIVEKIYADRRGNVWVAAFGDGLLRIDPQQNRVVGRISASGPQGHRLWNNNVKDLLQYNDSMLVVASGALNLVNLNTGRVEQLSNAQGLPTNTVQSIAIDGSGMLWLGTLNGLCHADIGRRSFTTYNQRDGLLNELFNVAGAHTLNDGRLLFTSLESFVVFDPAEARRTDPIDKALLTDIRLMNRPVPVDSVLALKKIRLRHNQSNLLLEFSALNFNRLSKLDYYYQLENFDSTWVHSDGRHQAIYTYLPPGQYRFKLRTRNMLGVYGPETVQLDIQVNPPFWKTWWFYLSLALLVALGLYLIDRERVKRLAALYHVRSEIATHLHQDVSTTLNNINVLSQIAKLKADKDLVRSKELIDEISGKSSDMMQSMDEILWSIDPGNDTMQKTVLRLYEYAEILGSSTGAAIDIIVHDKVKHLRLDMKLRHDLLLLCKEALRTLAQNTGEGAITLDIDFVRSRICLKILSQGSETTHYSTQMQALKKNMTEQARSLQGQLVFEIGKRDTAIILSLPAR